MRANSRVLTKGGPWRTRSRGAVSVSSARTTTRRRPPTSPARLADRACGRRLLRGQRADVLRALQGGPRDERESRIRRLAFPEGGRSRSRGGGRGGRRVVRGPCNHRIRAGADRDRRRGVRGRRGAEGIGGSRGLALPGARDPSDVRVDREYVHSLRGDRRQRGRGEGFRARRRHRRVRTRRRHDS